VPVFKPGPFAHQPFLKPVGGRRQKKTQLEKKQPPKNSKAAIKEGSGPSGLRKGGIPCRNHLPESLQRIPRSQRKKKKCLREIHLTKMHFFEYGNLSRGEGTGAGKRG